MINTYNETSLHKTLKTMYALQTEGDTEVQKDGHIYDIFTPQNEVIEIQTQNLSKLYPKLKDALSHGHKCRAVYTIIQTKIIQLYNENHNLISSRKSPKKSTVYSLFRELTGIYPLLLEPEFTLEVLIINTTEIRLQTPEAVQTKNNSRRFKKNWLKTDKKLNEILQTIKFKNEKDYLKLLPDTLPEIFTAKDLYEALKKEKLPAAAYNSAHLVIWVLNKMNLIKFTEKHGRANAYRIIKN